MVPERSCGQIGLPPNCLIKSCPQTDQTGRRIEMKTMLFAVLTLTMAATPAIAGSDLAKSKKCFTCHAVDKELKGPSFQAIAKLHKGTDKAEAKLADKIIKGGAEHWGSNVMPPADVRGVKISDAEAKELARWVLTQ
jgi:cytochrome c